MSFLYYVVLGITAISYLLGLFLSYCEKKEKTAIMSNLGNTGFVNVFGNDYLEHMKIETPVMYQQGISNCSEQSSQVSSYMDEEII